MQSWPPRYVRVLHWIFDPDPSKTNWTLFLCIITFHFNNVARTNMFVSTDITTFEHMVIRILFQSGNEINTFSTIRCKLSKIGITTIKDNDIACF